MKLTLALGLFNYFLWSEAFLENSHHFRGMAQKPITDCHSFFTKIFLQTSLTTFLLVSQLSRNALYYLTLILITAMS